MTNPYDMEKLLKDDGGPLTLGDFRDATDHLPDDMPLLMSVPEELCGAEGPVAITMVDTDHIFGDEGEFVGYADQDKPECVEEELWESLLADKRSLVFSPQ